MLNVDGCNGWSMRQGKNEVDGKLLMLRCSIARSICEYDTLIMFFPLSIGGCKIGFTFGEVITRRSFWVVVADCVCVDVACCFGVLCLSMLRYGRIIYFFWNPN